MRVTAHDKFVCRWLVYYLEKWSGITPISSTVWSGPQLTIFTDIGTRLALSGVIWGIGAWCRESGEFISQPWKKKFYDQARVKETGEISVPFLESYAIMAAVLTLTPNAHRVQVYTDCSPAAQICSSRWCKTNSLLNRYIAYFDFECTNRDIFFQVTHLEREDNFGAHHLSQGQLFKARDLVPLTVKRGLINLETLF